jgi:hypothetical protein
MTSKANSNLFTQLDKSMFKDEDLMSLKLAVDNAFLEYKARDTKLGWIPKIEQYL